MEEKIKEIFELKDIVWFVMGFAVPYIFNLIKGKVQSFRMKRKIKKTAIEFTDNGIVSLAHGEPFFSVTTGNQDIKLDVPREMFYISMPEDIKKQILENKSDFFNTKWEDDQAFLDGQTETDMLTEVSQILRLSFEDTKKIYLEEKTNVALMFLEKAKAGDAYFNGEMYGIKKINLGRKGEHEISKVYISAYRTDYYTHRVMASIYRRVYKNNKDIVPDNNPGGYNKMRYFLTSMGMNVLLYLKDEGKIVFVKRSGKLINMPKSLWHVSMNEAISITDISETTDAIDLHRCISRGLNEELGFDIRENHIDYSDLFFLKDPFETGISAFVTVNNCSFSDLKLLYRAAKDKELESEDLTAVELSPRHLVKFMKENELTDAAQYLIQMLLARHKKGAI